MAPTIQSGKFYVDNQLNRQLGRVGLPLGSRPYSRKNINSKLVTRSYQIGNASNCLIGRAGRETGTSVISQPVEKEASRSSSPKRYVDNELNRQLGRVGLEIPKRRKRGFNSRKAETQDQSIRILAEPRTTYVDNPKNRKLNRVRLPYGIRPEMTTNRHKMAASAPIRNQKMVAVPSIFVSHNPNRHDLLEEAMVQTFGSTLVGESAATSASISLPDDYVLYFSDLTLGKKIGEGTFGEVYRAKWLENQDVAVKKLKVQTVSRISISLLEEEMKILMSLDDPTIIHLYGACVMLPNLALVMEFMPAGSLYKILHEDNIPLTGEHKNNIIEDALSALAYIHSRKVVHRDIKSSNVMMCEDLNHCKLTDFGLALIDRQAAILENNVTYSAVGTYAYCPPEVLKAARLTVAELMQADVYSMTVMILEVLSGKRPFDRYSQLQIQRAVLGGERPNLYSTQMSDDMFTLLSNCLSASGIQRPSALQLWQSFVHLKSD